MMLAFSVQARGAFAQLILIYLIICTVPPGLGTWLLVAPRRGGTFLNDAFAVFPLVGPKDGLKKLLYRAGGLGLIAVSVFYIHRIYGNIVSPISHFFRK
jgi:hypothetical protein